MKTTLLSIVIPSKNRSNTLNDLVKYFLTCDLSDVEVIIEDNSDVINQHLSSLDCLQIKYCHSNDKRSMVENCELAVSKASGTFVSMLGDDDGIDLELAKKIILAKNYDFYLSPSCTFYWPGLNRRIYGIRPYGYEAKYIFCKSRNINPAFELEKVLSTGGIEISNLPRLYQGIVRRSCLEQIRSVRGHYFNAPMPDMSSSVALSLFCSIGYLHEIPFIINGVSSNSGGGMGAKGKHVGKLESAYGLTVQHIAQWPTEVPQFWSGGTVWSASLITTLKNLGFDDLIKRLNINRIYAHIIAQHFYDYYKIHGLHNLKLMHFMMATSILLKRFKFLLSNINLYLKLSMGHGIKCNSISEYLCALKQNKRSAFKP